MSFTFCKKKKKIKFIVDFGYSYLLCEMWEKLWGYIANMSPEKQEEVEYVSFIFGFIWLQCTFL